MGTDEKAQVLHRAWHVAVENGFRPIDNKHLLLTDNVTGVHFGYETWLFDHDFAKALWGDGNTFTTIKDGVVAHDGWQHHLQQMILAREPVAYLKDNLVATSTSVI